MLCGVSKLMVLVSYELLFRFGTRLGVRCWLVVSGTGFACGYGGNEKVRVSVRERAPEMKKEHFPKTVLKSKPLLNTCVQRRFFENLC